MHFISTHPIASSINSRTQTTLQKRYRKLCRCRRYPLPLRRQCRGGQGCARSRSLRKREETAREALRPRKLIRTSLSYPTRCFSPTIDYGYNAYFRSDSRGGPGFQHRHGFFYSFELVLRRRFNGEFPIRVLRYGTIESET